LNFQSLSLVTLEEELPEPAAVDEGLDWREGGQQGKHFPILVDVRGKL